MGPATYPSCPFVGFKLKKKKNNFKRDLEEKEHILLAGPLFYPSLSLSLCPRLQCNGWNCNRWTSFDHEATLRMEATVGMAEQKDRGKWRDGRYPNTIIPALGHLSPDFYVKRKLILFSLSHYHFRSLVTGIDQYNRN